MIYHPEVTREDQSLPRPPPLAQSGDFMGRTTLVPRTGHPRVSSTHWSFSLAP